MYMKNKTIKGAFMFTAYQLSCEMIDAMFVC